jgi:eukaryotic-like serine/threonine-protein kinase
LQPGSLLAMRYEILERLGGGGMGTVYKAKDREVNRLVAVKVIREDLAGDSAMLSRFKQELILARKVTHKNVIRIFDLGQASGIRFITMEYIEGQDLRSLVRTKGKPTPEESVNIIQQVCLALEAAHAEGIVHRDLKPQNIMVDEKGKIYVMDFGIARSLGGEGLTMTGAVVGTPEYMSPEQVKGEDVDGRSDIFSLGIISYDLLTGKLPYRSETVQQAMYKRTRERPVPAAAEDATVPVYLSEVVSKCLEIEPAKRYQSARQLYDELERWKNGVAEQAVPVLQRKLRRIAGNRSVLVSAVVVLLVVVGTFVVRRIPVTSSGNGVKPATPSIALAVFPFRNASGDQKLDWLGSSLSEMLTNDIGQSASLRTISAGRISQVLHDLGIRPESELDSGTIERLGEFTNADIVIYGQYAKFGDEIRIDAKLADRKNSRQVALKAEAANETEILKTVDQLAKEVQNHLALSSKAIQELQTRAFKPSTNSLAALREYDKGLQFERSGKKLEALAAFNASIAEDPNFALAMSQLARTYASMGQEDQAQSASRKSVELSDALPQQERYIIRANHSRILKEYPKAIESYEALATGSPGDTDILFELAGLYESAGDLVKARAELEKVQVLDPKRSEVPLALGRVELKSNNPEKGLEFLSSALNLSIQLNNEEQRADILHAMGVGYAYMHRNDEALRSFKESLAIKRRLGMKAGAAVSLDEIATLESGQGKSDEALKNFNEALKLRREVGDKAGAGDVLTDLGTFYVDRGKPEQAMALFKESLQIQIDTGNEQNRGMLLNNIGNIYLSRGDFQDAHTYFEQALQVREKFNVPQEVAETLHNVAETDTNLGLYDQALAQYHKALDLQRQVANKQMIAIETSSLGTVFGYQGRYGAALSSKEEAIKLYGELGEKGFWMVDIQGGYGNALSQVGRKEESQKSLQEALTMARELKNEDQVSSTLGFLGDNAYYSGDLAAAKKYYQQASQAGERSSARVLKLTNEFNLARLLVVEGHALQAIPALTSILDETTKNGPKYLAAQSSLCLGTALLGTKNYTKAKEVLQNTLLQAEKLGLLAVQAQVHAVLAKVYAQEKNTAEEEREKKLALQLFQEIQTESHFDLRTRHEFAGLFG